MCWVGLAFVAFISLPVQLELELASLYSSPKSFSRCGRESFLASHSVHLPTKLSGGATLPVLLDRVPLCLTRLARHKPRVPKTLH